jgi:tetratricopeptide (TPR) repeat protein
MNRRKLGSGFAIAAVALMILAGCDAGGDQSSYDFGTPVIKQESMNLSIGEAVDIVQRDARHGEAGGQPYVLAYTPQRFVEYIYAKDGTHVRGEDCPYEAARPFGDGGASGFTIISLSGDAAEAEGLGKDTCGAEIINVPTQADATRLAEAFWRLQQSTMAEREAWRNQEAAAFAKVAATYRAASPKPQISEAVHRYDVMAAAAVRNKNFADAVDAYEDALKVAPWWPQGQFNAALALGELRYYDEAIEHMRKYLALVPNAPDARQARGKVYEWQEAEKAF